MSWLPFQRRTSRRHTDIAYAELARIQAEAVLRLELDNEQLRCRLAEKDRHYAALVERLVAPQLVATKVMLPGVPENAALAGAKDEYITRMAEDFVNHANMTPEMATAEARRLAHEAENRMY